MQTASSVRVPILSVLFGLGDTASYDLSKRAHHWYLGPAGMQQESMAAKSSEWRPRTELGKMLVEIRAQIIASGEKLLDWDEVLDERNERRGERKAGEWPS